MKVRLYRLFLVLLACLTVSSIFVIYSWLSSVNLNVHDGGEPERSWSAAVEYCHDQGQRLASVTELTGLLLRGQLRERKTDYWSATRIGGYAFGVNRKSRILSFDRLADTDHFVCIDR